MNLSSEVKEFLEHAGKMLIFEENEPKFVVSTFKNYMDLVRGGKYDGVTVDDVLDQKNISHAEPAIQEKSPYEANNRQQQVEEINRELEVIAAENLFLQLPVEEISLTTNQPQSFYRELE